MKNVLLTGASGFLGKAIDAALRAKGLTVHTLGRKNADVLWDLSTTLSPKLPAAELVVHAAGLAHTVPKKFREIKAFFNVNYFGTLRLLKALEKQLPKQLVFISTVAVYGVETGTQISEEYPLNGITPYALSKIKAEELVRNWGREQGVAILILRLPLLAGTHPPGNLGAMAKAIKKGYYFRIGAGSARKSMVSTADVAQFIAELQGQESGVYNLTDGLHSTIAEIDTTIAKQFDKKVRQLPESLLRTVARFGDRVPGFPFTTIKFQKLTHELTFSDAKAREQLGWRSSLAVSAVTFEK
ncbi:MAG: NAD-dependent epimerase/dehydratase family protein [Schleiferiaceae bacterium]|nr:NAD-dependent epimerase/dehydratase family protein [Schleiferiaceae bacterium]